MTTVEWSPLCGVSVNPEERVNSTRSRVSRIKRQSAKENDYLIEVVDLKTGTPIGGVLFASNDGTFIPKKILPARTWVAVGRDSLDRVIAYNLTTGACTGKIFGVPYGLAADSKELIIRHDSRRFSLYDMQTMQKRDEYTFSTPVTHLQLTREGNRMFALTSDQTAYVIQLASP